MRMSPPLVVDSDGLTALTVDLRPDVWFSTAQGTVLALPEWDWDDTGRLLDLRAEVDSSARSTRRPLPHARDAPSSRTT